MCVLLELIKNPVFTAIASGLGVGIISLIANVLLFKHQERLQAVSFLLSERLKAYKEFLTAIATFQEELTQVHHREDGRIPPDVYALGRKLGYVFLANKAWIDRDVQSIFLEMEDLIFPVLKSNEGPGIVGNDLATIRIMSVDILARLTKLAEAKMGVGFLDRWTQTRIPEFRKPASPKSVSYINDQKDDPGPDSITKKKV
jgi:hypothetical protein